MIEVMELTKRYGETTAVSGVSFTVPQGTVVGFLGPNGAGKSTTMRVLAGALAPTAGAARVGGLDVVSDSLAVRAAVGYLPENNPLYEDMDAGEYLEWTAGARGLAGERRRAGVAAAVEACSLGGVLDRPLGVLSKGFRQRVGLAAAIVHDPPVLLLDEPTSGLDPNQAREVRALIQRLKHKKTVLLSTHILSEVEAVCDRAVILSRGRIAAEGAVEELARRGGPGAVRVALAAAGLDAEAARAALATLAGVNSVEAVPAADGEAAFSVRAEGDVRGQLSALAARSGWMLLELSRAPATLDEVFRQLAGEEE